MLNESAPADATVHRTASRIAYRIAELTAPFLTLMAYEQVLSSAYKIAREEIEEGNRPCESSP